MLEASTTASRLPAAQLSWTTMLALLASPSASGLTHSLRSELKDLRAPTLFIWGDKDLGPPRLGQEMAALAPHARCEVVADAGHIVWLDQPGRCSKLTIEFLKTA
jgi:pimeloyl-ACP methyl ester carboxylesterase